MYFANWVPIGEAEAYACVTFSPQRESSEANYVHERLQIPQTHLAIEAHTLTAKPRKTQTIKTVRLHNYFREP